MLNSKGGAKMNRKLSYNGKTIQEMTKSELQEQYEKNKKRMATRAGFFGVASLATFAVVPVVGIVPLGIGAITAYWLKENNEAIEEELSRRR